MKEKTYHEKIKIENELKLREQLQLLATNGMLVKRPLVVNNDMVLVGFKQAEWSEKI